VPALKATFDVRLPTGAGYLLVSRPRIEPLEYQVSIGRFMVAVRLLSDGSGEYKRADEPFPSYWITRMLIDVTGEENDAAPKGELERFSYVTARRGEYQASAAEAVNRVIRFFKYRLRNPLLRELEVLELVCENEGFDKPRWSDEAGNEITNDLVRREGSGTIRLQLGRLNESFLGIRKLTRDDDAGLRNALGTPIDARLDEELLADAQAAFFAGHYKRAVLEMAIACEVRVKVAFFGNSGPASAALEHLERTRTVRVTDLIAGAAKIAFGESFRETFPEDYRHIDFLFRCRNSVAHRAEVAYRDDGGVLHQVERETLDKWWQSLEVLGRWLDERGSN